MWGTVWGGSAIDAEAAASLVWRALADPTMRRILDLLRVRPRTTGEIASHFETSRIAVMRHLDVLSSAGLVTSRKRGRARWHYLNAVPLQEMYERWVETLPARWSSGLLGLRRRVADRMNAEKPIVDVALDVDISAPPNAVFAALTRDPGGWWGPPYLRSDTIAVTLDARLGGHFVEVWTSGGAILATVTGLAHDRHLELTGPFHLGLALGIASFDVNAVPEGTRLAFSFRAIGAVDPDVLGDLTKGWTELVAERLKTLMETGTRLGIAPDPPAPEVAR